MKIVLSSIRMLIIFTIVTGVAYPALTLGLAKTFFPDQSTGSLVRQSGKVVGSALIAQKFTQPGYFHSRPSASDYEAVPSGASNLSPASKKLQDMVAARRAGGESGDMLFASGSGLDPEISPQSALLQIPRILEARMPRRHQGPQQQPGQSENGARGIFSDSPEFARQKLEDLVRSLTAPPTLGLLGQARVNVLRLNLALDGLSGHASRLSTEGMADD